MEVANLTQTEIIVAIVLALRQLDLTPVLAPELRTAEGKSISLFNYFFYRRIH
jgi:hypothetical protein